MKSYLAEIIFKIKTVFFGGETLTYAYTKRAFEFHPTQLQLVWPQFFQDHLQTFQIFKTGENSMN